MPSSYTRLYVHLVWATRLREPRIVPALAPRLYGMLSAQCRRLQCVALAVGGIEDHVHMLVGLHPSVDVARLAREIKATSSAFAKNALGIQGFTWQEGYGAFTLRETETETVRLYIINQPAHHADGTCVDEWEIDGVPDPDDPGEP